MSSDPTYRHFRAVSDDWILHAIALQNPLGNRRVQECRRNAFAHDVGVHADGLGEILDRLVGVVFEHLDPCMGTDDGVECRGLGVARLCGR